ncbi:MAG: metallophosphoesterase family protein [Clostridia bacterium]|nr:metallophosphoesterase family protein [Clostridia bacterium]
MKRGLALLLLLLLAFGAVWPAAARESDRVSRITCSIFDDGATGRGFCWYTNERGGTDLELLPTARFTGDFSGAKQYTGTAVKYRGLWSHQVAVTDLASGTAYTYRVGDRARGVWSGACSFVTDDRDDRFSFLTIADVQARDRQEFFDAAQTLRTGLETLPDAEFIVNLGDYVNKNTNEEWDDYFDAFTFANETVTGVPVAGNHDGSITNKFNTNCFKNMFCVDRSANRSLEGVYYSFDYGNAHFTVLNTNDMYPMSQAQKNWLVNDVTGSNAQWKILLMHRSFYSAGKNINKPDTLAQRALLLPLIDRLGIDLVLSGHDHMYLRTAPMRGDRRAENVTCIQEVFHGETLTFAVDPDGTVYAMPSTAGQKRYLINENALDPILPSADCIFSARNVGGCFAAVEIEGDRLVYRAYLVSDDDGACTRVDTYAVKKTVPAQSRATHLDTSLVSSIVMWPGNLLAAVAALLASYLKLLWQVTVRRW